MKEFISNLIPPSLYSLYAAMRRWILFIFYLGGNKTCPFCGWCFRKFLPTGSTEPVWREKKIVGGGWRENALCPRCYSVDKERLVYIYLKEKTDLFNNSRQKEISLLHIAPEVHLEPIFRKTPRLKYLTGDINPERAMEKIDIVDIRCPQDTFDVIICSHVLEHVEDDRKAMSELYRVLQPGGWAILQVPISLTLEKTFEDLNIRDPQEREKIFGQSDHVRIYGKDYKSRLEEAGFRVEVWSAKEEKGEGFVRKYALSWEEKIYVGFK